VVLENVLKKVTSERLAVHVVWMPVLRSDDLDSAREARALIPDPRVAHYWDPEQSVGLAFGRVVDMPRGRELAWDIYFAFGTGMTWGDVPPAPDAWAHQLGLDDRHLGEGSGLRAAVEELLGKLRPAAATIGG
jgi:hypothetical protein